MAPDSIVVVDPSRRIAYINRAAERMFGYLLAEVLGRPLGVLVPEWDRGAGAALDGRSSWSAAGRAGVQPPPATATARRKDGATLVIEASVGELRTGTRAYYTLILRDVSARSRTEHERTELLRRERVARAEAEREGVRTALLARASAVLDSSLDYEPTIAAVLGLCVPEVAPVCIADLWGEGGTIRRLEAHRVSLDGNGPDSAITVEEHDRPLNRSFLRRPWGDVPVLAHGIAAEEIGVFARADGQLATDGPGLYSSYICAPLAARGRLLGVLAVIATDGRPDFGESDIPFVAGLASRAAMAIDNARLYREATKSVAMRDDVLGIVSHELRSPLGAIMMAASRLDELEPMALAERGRMIEIVRRAAESMLRIIGDLLDAASIDRGGLSVERGPTDLADILLRARATFEPQFRRGGVALTFDVAREMPLVAGDAERLLQVVGNLLTNAAKCVPAGGKVLVSAVREGAGVVVRVADDGPGIVASDLPRIFDRYRRMRRGSGARGPGLGLSIAKGIVEALGGRIWVDSVEGRGATFSFSLACWDPEGRPPAPA